MSFNRKQQPPPAFKREVINPLTMQVPDAKLLRMGYELVTQHQAHLWADPSLPTVSYLRWLLPLAVAGSVVPLALWLFRSTWMSPWWIPVLVGLIAVLMYVGGKVSDFFAGVRFAEIQRLAPYKMRSYLAFGLGMPSQDFTNEMLLAVHQQFLDWAQAVDSRQMAEIAAELNRPQPAARRGPQGRRQGGGSARQANAPARQVERDPRRNEDSSPAFNVDGTPMVGAFDMHGRPYGFAAPVAGMGLADTFSSPAPSCAPDHSSSSSSSWSDPFSSSGGCDTGSSSMGCDSGSSSSCGGFD